MYEIAICDDDQEAIFSLEHQIAAILSDLGIQYHIVTFSSGEDLLQYMNENSTDFAMIFLDIVMKEKNGIDTAKAIRRINDKTGIIFTTFSDQYVFTGYEVHALQYLLKPINPTMLAEALSFDMKRRLVNQYFVFRSSAVTHKVPYDDIEYFESALKLVKVVTKQGDYHFYAQLSNIETSLPKPFYCRCHRAFIVNLKKVAAINSYSITTASGHTIPIGKLYAKPVSQAFLRYMADNEDN